MNIFKTKYRIIVSSHNYFWAEYKKWYWPFWEPLNHAPYDSLEAAKGCIALEKSNPVWEE